MKIREYFACDDAEQTWWRARIGESDWSAGQTLHGLLERRELRTKEWIGADARLYLLIDDQETDGYGELVSFCTLAGNDDVPDTELAPWVGFVYTFPAYRGQHRFGTLLAHAIEQARCDKYQSLYISSGHVGLYEKYGAVFLMEAKDAWGGDTRIHRLDFGWQEGNEAERAAGLPTRERAERILSASALLNPGFWDTHSRYTATAAERIARACGDIDPERAYICGLLHDIGRRFGRGHLRHVYDGWQYMMKLGYPAAARICLTHSFKRKRLDDYVGNHDLTPEETSVLEEALAACDYDDMDLLIQLCDSIAGDKDIVQPIEERMLDVKRRYGGYYPQEKWDANLALLHDFERRVGGDIYAVALDKGR